MLPGILLSQVNQVTMCYPGTALDCGMRPVKGPGNESSTINNHEPQRHDICNLLLLLFLAFSDLRRLNQ